jgi:hypothetical protein
MTTHALIEALVCRAGLNRFFVTRVVQRLERGELSTREAAELLTNAARMPARAVDPRRDASSAAANELDAGCSERAARFGLGAKSAAHGVEPPPK